MLFYIPYFVFLMFCLLKTGRTAGLVASTAFFSFNRYYLSWHRFSNWGTVLGMQSSIEGIQVPYTQSREKQADLKVIQPIYNHSCPERYLFLLTGYSGRFEQLHSQLNTPFIVRWVKLYLSTVRNKMLLCLFLC